MQSSIEHKVQEFTAYPEMNYTSIKPQVYEFEKQESDNLCKESYLLKIILAKTIIRGVFTMKKKLITLTLIAALSATTTAFAAEIPRESAPLNATEQQIQITENLISDILDEVQTGNLGYTLAAGYSNTRIRKAVIANQTGGNGYSILSPIAQNAIRVMRNMQLRPDADAQAEEELTVLLADLITEVQNGKDYMEAVKEAYIKIYQTADASFDYDEQFSFDTCYRDIPVVGMEKLTVARKLLLEAKK